MAPPVAGVRPAGARGRLRRGPARLHATIADARADRPHKATTSIVREHQAIALEDLAVSGPARSRCRPRGEPRRGTRQPNAGATTGCTAYYTDHSLI
ncbi:transposase [Actinopolyspora halophila]|uniref:transposase n=1 Tax=Actinopolyspora halophila TaxID=1850 RepID=UPI00316AECC6